MYTIIRLLRKSSLLGCEQGLKEIDLDIDPRQIVGITGKSGCGKSTMAKLIQGLYRPQSGIVGLDNIDLRLLDLSHIRSQVSFYKSFSRKLSEFSFL